MRGRSGRIEVLRLLGLARRAGAAVPGTDAARRAVLQGQARLIVMAADASGVQLDKIRKALRNRPIPQVTLGDRATLGAAVGRASVSVVAVTAAAFADQIQHRLEEGEGGRPVESEEER